MPEPIFCVDLGAAYTKVALRTTAHGTANLVQLGPSSLDLWLPTVVAADWSGGQTKPKLEFGERAAGIKPGPKIQVYTNFKKNLFATADSEKPAPHPLDALFASEDFEALATKYGVSVAALTGLRRLVAGARLMLGVSETTPQHPARKQEEAKVVAHHFFKWLHEQTLTWCEKLPHRALNYREIPLRVAVPVFGSTEHLDKHPGCVRLREALAGTGWMLDERLFVSEPESNTLGVLTKATNIVQRTGRAHLGQMFGKGPFITVVKGDPHHPTYRALVIDVGAYTTDYAALQIKTDGKFVETTEAGWFGIIQRSVPVGVSDLDASVLAALPEEKRTALDALARKDFAAFQISTYTDETGYRVGPGKTIGGAADRPLVESCLAEFCKRLTDEAAAFLQQLEPASMQELILTGGGNNIPTVRDALLKAAAQTPGSSFVRTHAAGLKKLKSGPPVDPLPETFARGASALGGASIYFEKSYW